MKNWGLWSVALLLLSGCFSQGSDYDLYQTNNLRAPSYQPYERAASATSNEGPVPHSVTQPMNINPVPQSQQTNNAPVSTVQPVQTAQPTQPLVQTIVIPQYTPTPGMMPYGQVPYGVQTPVQPMGAQPYNNAQQITIPSQQVYMPSAIPENVVQKATGKINIPQPKIKTTTTVSTKKSGEQVYPTWAASDFKAQSTSTPKDHTVYFSNPHRNEIVQCSSIDVMCTASYQQQGYKQVNAPTQVAPVVAHPQPNKSGYPDTEWDSNSIPRW